jgi:hypothetical protein
MHSYSAAGTYTATVVITDAHGYTLTQTVTVTVQADSDLDGYTDQQEQALGTNPNDANSKPGGTADFDHDGLPDDVDPDDDNDLVPDVQEIADGTNPYDATSFKAWPLTLMKISGSAKNGGGKDAFALTGIIPNGPALADLANQPIAVNIGGVVLTFAPNLKGKAVGSNGTLALVSKAPRGGGSRTLTFTISAKKGTWAPEWLNDGVDLSVTQSKVTIKMPVTFALPGAVYTTQATCGYSSKAGKSATFKR